MHTAPREHCVQINCGSFLCSVIWLFAEMRVEVTPLYAILASVVVAAASPWQSGSPLLFGSFSPI